MLEKIVIVLASAITGYLLLLLGVAMYTEAECLRNGYPKYAVTIGLERYCMTMDGAVTVRVDKAAR